MKTVAVDIRILQNTFSRDRGIGEVAKRVSQGIINNSKRDFNILFVTSKCEKENSPLRFLDLSSSSINTINDEDYRIGDADIILNFSHALKPLDLSRTLLVVHDLIILKFWDIFCEYLMNLALNSFLKKLFRIFNQLPFSKMFLKQLYKFYIKNRSKCKKMIAVSETTKKDYVEILGCNEKSIKVIYLGVDSKSGKTVNAAQEVFIPEKPFLFFVGGSDPKRELHELVLEFDKLKDNKQDIQLIFAGSSFVSLDTITDTALKASIESSKYSEDILLLGYISDEIRNELYKKALAFVYPSIYEGFGLPVLEAMIFKCPIIYYSNSSMKEINKGFGFPIDNSIDIAPTVEKIITMPQEEIEKNLSEAYEHASKFTWNKTIENYIDFIKAELYELDNIPVYE